MSERGAWPRNARGAVCLSFDNLGEAAEIELGAIEPGAPLGGHPSVTVALPRVLAALEARGLAATFFVEGLNAELYPETLRAIADAGHEVGYHAWRHEQWGDLSAAKQADNLKRGLAALEGLGLTVTGMRPPGGGLGEGGLDVLRSAGLRYCSPAGDGAGASDGIALLPFRWRHVDATCVLPPLGAVREEISGSTEPLGPAAFADHMEGEIARLREDGGFAAIVLHPFMLDWLGEERLGAILDAVARGAESSELWVARCGEAAEHVLDHAGAFAGGTALDPTTWSG